MIVTMEFDLKPVLENETEHRQTCDCAVEMEKLKKSYEIRKEIVASMMKLKLLFDELVAGE